jgi:hypothetical protein
LLLDDLLADASEDFRALSGEFGEDLAVECEIVLLELSDKCGV